jgi:hypothetical protein
VSSPGGELNQPVADYLYRDLGQRLDPAAAEPREWGCFIHPDEFRRVYMVGNSRLETSSGEQITNDQIKHWIDLTVGAFADYIEHDIYPRLRRARLPGAGVRDVEPFAEYEDLAKVHINKRKHIHQLQCKPLARLHGWKICAYDGSEVFDLTKFAVPLHSHGLLRAGLRIGVGQDGGAGWRRGGVVYGGAAAGGINPEDLYLYCADYTSGYDHATRVPRELKAQIIDQLIIEISSAFGEGIAGGLASSSLSVGPLHESINTTMSSMSGFYGARINEKVKSRARWDKLNLARYRGIKFASS